jgi:branched-chain amino acid transport system ATP-binding protein
MTAADVAVELVDVRKRFGGVTAVAGVSAEARHGEITGLIGPNGSGKSTLMNLISGQLRADSGRISVNGRDVTRERPERRAANGLARMFQQARLIETLSPLDNVAIGAWATRRGPVAALSPRRWRTSRERARRAVEELGIGHLLDRSTESLTHVERRMLEIARLLSADATTLLLDEPMAGLDRAEKERATAAIRALRTPQRAVIVVEHDVPFVVDLCDRLTCLAGGAVISSGSPHEVAADPTVRAIYLGQAVETADQ